MVDAAQTNPVKNLGSVPARASLRDLLAVAACFGLAGGLVEACGLLLFQKLNWMNWLMGQMAVAPEILWISPAMNMLVFTALALGIAAVGKFLLHGREFSVAVFVFAALSFFNWLSLTGKLRFSGVVVLSLGLAAVLMRRSRRNEVRARAYCRRTWPWAIVVWLLIFGVVEGGGWLRERIELARLPAAAPGAPNIVVIVVDTLRADHLPAYGYARNTSPEIDRLAQQSVVFDNAIASSSWTLPSHATFLTGRYEFEHGAERETYDGRFPVLGNALQQRGYRTAAISANTAYFGRREGFGAGFMHFEDYFHTIADRALRTMFGRKFEQYVLMQRGWVDYPSRKLAPEVTDAALRWVDRNPGVPFFLFLNYFDVHDPYLPPQPYRSRFSKLKNPGGRINGKLLQVDPKLTPEEIQGEIDAYDGAISYAGEHIGRFLAELKKRGMAENTIVVFTSDHGEMLGEHGIFHHRNALYRELIHVPMFIQWKGHTPAGMRVAVPVSIGALPATLMDMIGAGEQTMFPGPSLAKLWKNPPGQAEWPDPLAELAQFHYEAIKNQPTYYGAMKSLVSSKWQYIHHEKLGDELYDWAADPKQSQNLARTAAGQQIAAEYRAKLQAMLERKAK